MPIGKINPPTVGIQDEPTVSICINTDWVGQLTGIIYPAQYPEWWAGTLAENRFARMQIRQLLYILSTAEGCNVANTCCEPIPVIKRFNPDTFRPEVSYDNGVTWEPSPDDPQNAIPLYPSPVVEGGNTKCDAANAGAQHIKDLIDATHNNLTTASTIFGLAVGIAEAILALVLILVTAGAIAPYVTAVATAIWGAATSIFALGIEAFDDYWTSDKTDAILCTLYCNIGDNGQFTESQYQAWRSDIKGTLPASPAFDIIMTSINATGSAGLSQMCSYGLQEGGDCSECTECLNCPTVEPESSGYSVFVGFDDETCIWTFDSVPNPTPGVSPYVVGIDFNVALPNHAKVYFYSSDATGGWGFGWYPHGGSSEISGLTYPQNTDVDYWYQGSSTPFTVNIIITPP